MIDVARDISWLEAGAALAALAGASFFVSWLATDVARIGRTAYIAALAVVTALAAAGTLSFLDIDAAELVGHRWLAGIGGAVLAGGIGGIGVRKFRSTLVRSGRDLREAEAWEGVVYGISEGVLLSVLPLLVAWQASADAGWPTWAGWLSAFTASVVVIAIHHFGYWDYRGRRVFEALAGCLILSLAYLATGSVIAPALGHVILHLAAVAKGVELPPHRRPVAA